MAYSAGLPFEQAIPKQLIDPKFEEEAFEFAFAEAESAVLASTMVEGETPLATEEPKLTDEQEADRLAETAGILFNRLQHERETDEKFRNSTFMALMRKLRDREVIVKDNNMVESHKTENDMGDLSAPGSEENLFM